MIRTRLVRLTLWLSVAVLSTATAFAQLQMEAAKLTAIDADDDDRFGWTVAVDGVVTLVGAFKHDEVALNAGAVYAFRREGTTWVQEAELLASDGASTDRFGWAVGLDGNVAIIGARTEDDSEADAGAAYVFRRSGTSWNQEAKLLATDGAAGDDFGGSVAIDGDLIVVGAGRNDDGGDGSGSAYVFRHVLGAWMQEAKLVAADASAGDDFGVAVRVSGNRVLVGADLENAGGSLSGSAYVFREGGGVWTQETKLVASDASPNDRFGFTVRVHGRPGRRHRRDRGLLGRPCRLDLGLRLRLPAVGHELVPGGQARGFRRGARGRVRLGGRRGGRHRRDRGTPGGRLGRGLRLGLCVPALGHHVDPGPEARRLGQGARRRAGVLGGVER